MRTLKYLSYILRHKWFVFMECCKYKLYWRGIIHDLSKLSPKEFIAYRDYFYRPKRIEEEQVMKEKNGGYYKPDTTGNPAFDLAWLRHVHKNPHHWQYWVQILDNGNTRVHKIPYKYMLEMLCDWCGAGRAQGYGDNTKEWWNKNKDKMTLHDETMQWLDKEINNEQAHNNT